MAITKKPQAAAVRKPAPAPVVDEDEEGVDLGESEEGGGVVIDLDGDYGDTSYEVLPRGIYSCLVNELTYGLSQNSGNPMWTLRLEVEDGDYAGRMLFTHLVFKGNALPRTIQTIKKCFSQLESPFNASQVAEEGILEGARVRARVEIRPYQGEPRNNVKALMPAANEDEE